MELHSVEEGEHQQTVDEDDQHEREDSVLLTNALQNSESAVIMHKSAVIIN